MDLGRGQLRGRADRGARHSPRVRDLADGPQLNSEDSTATQHGEPRRRDTSAEPLRRISARRCLAAATVAVTLPVLVAGVRAALQGWIPTGDNPYIAMRAWDVFSSTPPLLGTWSSASSYTGHQINHPGPLEMVFLAVPVRLLGHGAGSVVGIALVNAAAMAVATWLVARRAGPAVATLVPVGFGLLAWSMGAAILHDPWSQYAPLVPFALCAVAAWCAVAGDLVALPVMVVAGSYSFQTHLSYALLVPGLMAFVAVAVVVRLVQDRRADQEAWTGGGRRNAWRWLAVTAGVALVCWMPPLVEQLTADGEGNIEGLLRSSDQSGMEPGLRKALVAYGGTVAVPPAWLPPSFGSPSFHLDGEGLPLWLCTLALVALASALAVFGWRARSRGSTLVAAGTLTGLVLLALGLASTIRMPARMGMVPTYLRFAWPLAMVVWLTLAVAVVDEVKARWSVNSTRLAVAGLAVAVVAGVATLPAVDNASGSPPWTVEAADAVDEEVVAVAEDHGGILFNMELSPSVIQVGPAFLARLQAEGIPFYVEDEMLVRQFGEERRFQPGDTEWRLILKGGSDAQADPGEELVVAWSPLSQDEADELDELDDQLRTLVAEHGAPLRDGGVEVLQELERDQLLDAVDSARSHPDEVVDDGTLRELWSGATAQYEGRPLLDADVFPPDLMDRWSALVDERDLRPISLYLAPAPA